ncbi:MAG: MBL fold metallo-hydrolase [Phocaeicola sp.]|uniref:MBL fold metallo-hydrolase n=1 Tax=Phocaeicola sp. TaxID=2773926 RepID=UPI003FA03E5B
MFKGIILTMALMGVTSVCRAQEYDVESFTTNSGKTVDITLIKHGTLALNYDGMEIHVDPVADYGKKTDYTKFPKADVILITHEHRDHFDSNTIHTLMKEGTVLYLTQRCFDELKEGEVLKNGDRRKINDVIMLDVVPAYNTTPDHLQFHPKGVGNGYVLTIDGVRIYIAGDTEDIPEMSYLKDIDVAFLPVNQPYTMTVDQAVHAAEMFSPKVLYPYHFGQTDVNPIQTRLENSGTEVRIRAMQ